MLAQPAVILEYVLVLAFLAFFALVLLMLLRGRIDLTDLLSDPGLNGKASLSRFQLLVFTLVIGGLYLVLCIENAQFLDIPGGVLGLLGISGGSYLISKNLSGNPPAPQPQPEPPKVP